jgi:hypothetical protein
MCLRGWVKLARPIGPVRLVAQNGVEMMADGNPKAFMSYSWSSPGHEQWVVTLATELRAAGVDVVLDKWDLKEGHDAAAFMETMVSDPKITKVIMIFDRAYVEKTDKRQGGVGTEAQIISSQIYASQRQDKFAAIVTEVDADGRPYVPIYYKSRIYIDMSDPTRYAERFEQLVRWVFDKPLLQKPALGMPPGYLTASSSSSLRLAATAQRRAMQSLIDGAPSAAPLVEQYFRALRSDIAATLLDPSSEPFDDAVVDSIAISTDQRAEYADFVDVLSRYSSGEALTESVARGLESLLPLTQRPDGVASWKEWDFDNLKFQVHEIVLLTFAALLKAERFKEVSDLLRRDYYFERSGDGGDVKLLSYSDFRPYLRSLESRSERLGKGKGSRRTSIHADLLKERAVSLPITFSQLMQADLVLYLHGEMVDATRWYPISLLYASRSGPFEIFARARSTTYFKRIAPIFGVGTGDDFRAKLKQVVDSDRVPQYDWHSLEVWELTGANDIATRP